MLEGPRKPELPEAQKTLAKKRDELAMVRERLRSPGLRPGIARSCASTSPSWNGKSPNWSRPKRKGATEAA
jgi:hypothetical protein